MEVLNLKKYKDTIIAFVLGLMLFVIGDYLFTKTNFLGVALFILFIILWGFIFVIFNELIKIIAVLISKNKVSYLKIGNICLYMDNNRYKLCQFKGFSLIETGISLQNDKVFLIHFLPILINFILFIGILILMFLNINPYLFAFLGSILFYATYFLILNLYPIDTQYNSDLTKYHLIKNNPEIITKKTVLKLVIIKNGSYKNIDVQFEKLPINFYSYEYLKTMYQVALVNNKLDVAEKIIRYLYQNRSLLIQKDYNYVCVEYVSFLGFIKDNPQEAFNIYGQFTPRFKNAIEQISIPDYLKLSYLFNRFIKNDRILSENRKDEYTKKVLKMKNIEKEVLQLYLEMMLDAEKINFDLDIDITKKYYKTTFQGHSLILEGLQKYVGPVTMQYVPNGGIQSLFGGNIIIKTQYGYYYPQSVIYGGKRYEPKEFIDKYENISYAVLGK